MDFHQGVSGRMGQGQGLFEHLFRLLVVLEVIEGLAVFQQDVPGILEPSGFGKGAIGFVEVLGRPFLVAGSIERVG